jgi:hypothetical protein
LYQYLKAVKEKDPNGNGKPDEIGYADVGLNNLIYYLRGVSSPARSPSPTGINMPTP